MYIIIILVLLAVMEVIALQVMIYKKWIQAQQQDESDSAPVPATGP